MSRDYPVRGLNDLMQFLNAFPANLKRNAIAGGLRGAGAVVREEARTRAAKNSGKMAKAIKTSSVRTNQDGTMSIKVRLDPKSEHAYLGVFAEYGVARHLIARTGAKEGRVAIRKAKAGDGKISNGVMKIGPDFVSGILEHPGHGPHPFMRPSLDARVTDALEAFTVRIRGYIEGKTGFAMPADDEE